MAGSMRVLFRAELIGEDKWDLMERGILGAVNNGLRRAGRGVQKDMRAAVRAAKFARGGVGRQNFEKSFRVDLWPSRNNVYARRPAMTVGATARYAEVFEEGAEVSGKPYLAVPLPEARRLDLHTSGSYSRKKSNVKAAQANYGPLRRIPSKNGYILAADAKKLPGATASGGARPFVPLFAMVKQVKLTKRYSIRAIVEGWAEKLDTLIYQEFDKARW